MHQTLIQAACLDEIALLCELTQFDHFARSHVGRHRNDAFAAQLHKVQRSRVIATHQNEIFINQLLDLTNPR